MPEGVRYHILRADKEGCPPVIGYIFIDPAEAAFTCKKLAKELGEKLMVKPIIDPNWKEREKRRLADGTYRALPWEFDRWWMSAGACAIHRFHFAHPSIQRPGFIAYTKSEEDGSIDKQTIVRPGAYLKKYFETIMERYGVSERRMVDKFMELYGPCEVKFATTEDEIVAVYDNGPSTCMTDKEWPEGKHPASIYAAGDLQVAYLGDLERATARTLVWPEKKIHSRVYGDIARLTRGLQALGYKWGAPIGAKLKRIQENEVEFDPGEGYPTHCFVAPYIDKKNQQGGGHLSVIDKGDHLVICNEGEPGSHHCGLASGYSGNYVPKNDEYPTFTCDNCGTPGFRELLTVFQNADNEESSDWCNRCARRHAFKCNCSGHYYNKENVDSSIVDNFLWSDKYVEMYAGRCEMTGVLTNKENLIPVYIGGFKKLVTRDWIVEQGGSFSSHITGRKYLKRDKVTVFGNNKLHGYNLGLHELRYHSFECDGCISYFLLDERNQPNGDDKLYCLDCANKLGGAVPDQDNVEKVQRKYSVEDRAPRIHSNF